MSNSLFRNRWICVPSPYGYRSYKFLDSLGFFTQWLFPVPMAAGVTSFWVCWDFLHNGFEDSGLSPAMPYYMILAGGLEILQR